MKSDSQVAAVEWYLMCLTRLHR